MIKNLLGSTRSSGESRIRSVVPYNRYWQLSWTFIFSTTNLMSEISTENMYLVLISLFLGTYFSRGSPFLDNTGRRGLPMTT